MKDSSAGFTLIELLVVISIISVLSSVVLASLNAARTRGADSAVKATMRQIHNEAQNYLDLNTNLGLSVSNCTTGFFSSAKFTEMKNNIASNAASGATVSCATDSSGSKWGVFVSALKGGSSWCTDNSQGWFKPASSLDTTNAICQ